MSSNLANEILQKKRDSNLKGVAICDQNGFTIESEGTLKNAVMAHAAQAIELLQRIDEKKEQPTIRVETQHSSIQIIEQDGVTFALHK